MNYRNRNRSSSFLVLCLLMVTLATCGKDSPTRPEPPEPPPAPATPVATRVEIEPSSATLSAIGATVQLTARVFDQNNSVMSNATVNWSSDNISIATVSANGLVTAVKNGNAVITARSGGASATVSVRVAQTAVSLSIEPQMATLMSIGATVQLSATVLDDRGQPVEDAAVTWESGDAGVATVNDRGLVTAVGNGVTQVTARSGSAESSVAVSVMQSAASLSIEPQMATLMSIGATVQLSATVLDDRGQPVEDAAVTWESGDAGVATVNDRGLVTAVGNGVTQVTARSGSAESSVAVSVMQAAVSILIEPQMAMLMSIGATVQLSATVLDDRGQPVEDAAVTWRSGDAGVATVNDRGLVTAVGNGMTQVTARSGSAESSVAVSVMQAAVSILIEPQMAMLMSIGATVQLSATVLDDRGQPVEDAVVTWESGDAGVATVNDQGLVTAVGNGVTQVTARSGSAESSVPVSVMQSAVSISIEPQMATLMSIGATVQLSATVLDDRGQPVEDAVVTWRSGDAGVATVNAEGLVTAVGNGIARITATSGDASSGIDVTVTIRVPSPDRDVLVTLYHSLGGTGWTHNTNWLTDRHVDDWYGVNTDEEGRVTSLNLGGNNLTGQIPGELVNLAVLEGLSLERNNLTGPIPAELGELSELSLLYLFDNQLTGSIPVELGKLASLIHLCLNGNRLTGAIPKELGRLAKLKWLHLHYNTHLTGPLPAELADLELDALLLQGTQVCLPNDARLEKWISQVSDARVAQCDGIDLERNALEVFYAATNGPAWKNNTNWLSEAPLGEWYGVESDEHGRVIGLYLWSNNLSGTIPDAIGQLSGLVTLDLTNNGLTGTIPTVIGRLANLEEVSLGRNQLVGHIPAVLGQLSKLTVLRLDQNRLTGSIPAEVVQLTNLTELYLWHNRLSGSIPSEIANLAKLKNLWLSSNELTGNIPPELGQLADLTELHLERNLLEGSIPSELGQLTKLRDMFIEFNQLSGYIPAELGQLSSLEKLFLDGNQLTGSIPPELGQLSNLNVLSLSNDQLTGNIPAELGQLSSLERLYLYESQLAGRIPPELGQLSNLEILSLFDNQLTGNIPAELGQLSSLEGLYLYENQLAGRIPPELGKMTALISLNLSHNPSLSGPLPVEFTGLGSLEILYLEGTQLCVPSDPEFNKWLLAMKTKRVRVCAADTDREPLIAFYQATVGPNWIEAENWLSDQPLKQWYGVTTNDSSRVEQLILKGNNLAGGIPRELARLSHLRILDLSNNHLLAGPLPRTLIELPLEIIRLDGTRLCTPMDDEFQAWLIRIHQKSDILNCEGNMAGDRSVLTEFYHATNGPSWVTKTNWLSEKPLGEWYGVKVDLEGRVIELKLRENNLSGAIPASVGELTRLTSLEITGSEIAGMIPAELGKLTQLRDLILFNTKIAGSIPPELGELENLSELILPSNRLTGSIPPELGGLKRLTRLQLSNNELTGNIPAELGRLRNLQHMAIGINKFSGSIPAELGEMHNLEYLNLISSGLTGSIPAELGNLTNLLSLVLYLNQLTGGIPAELGNLTNLRVLELHLNQLTGGIPAELGNLTNLRELELSYNQISGNIPAELGQLTNLAELDLRDNQLSGSIPGELGHLKNLESIAMENNQLTGSIPAELGQLSNLVELDFSANRLSGLLPPQIGDLVNLESLLLSGNAELSGSVPLSLIGLDLQTLLLDGTSLCLPQESDFQEWFASIANRSRIVECRTIMNTEVYLSQAVQSFQRPVPLIEGEPALLRVFYATEETVSNRPPVKAIFYQDGAEVYTTEIPAGPAKIPVAINEGSLDVSSNAVVPGEVINPGLELVVEINPGDRTGTDSGVAGRIPESGRLVIDVWTVPPLHLTLVPMLSVEDPNYEIVSAMDGLTPENDLFREIRNLLPVQDRDFEVTIHKEVLTTLDTHPNNGRLTIELDAIRAMEGSSGHYMGIVSLDSRGGIANRPGYTSVSVLNAKTMAHELGHNFVLDHAPCRVPDPDPFYPYKDGSIGAWGYDIQSGMLIDPSSPDIMSYCFEGAWISDYHFNRAIDYRINKEEPPVFAASVSGTRSLLLWGGLDSDGDLILEPAFVVDASPALPRDYGPYRLVGTDASGRSLFRLSFDMHRIAHSEGGNFAFTVPVGTDWSSRLSRISLAGPEGYAELTRDSDRTAVILLDRSTGEVRGILRGWSAPGETVQAARRALPEPGLEVLVSPGIPDPSDW